MPRDRRGDLLPMNVLGKSERYVSSLSRLRILTVLLPSSTTPVRRWPFAFSSINLVKRNCYRHPTIKVWLILRLTDTIYSKKVALPCN